MKNKLLIISLLLLFNNIFSQNITIDENENFIYQNELFTPLGLNFVCEIYKDSLGYFAGPNSFYLDSSNFIRNRNNINKKTFEIFSELHNKNLNTVRLTALSVKTYKNLTDTLGFYYSDYSGQNMTRRFIKLTNYNNYVDYANLINKFINIIDSAGLKTILLAGGDGNDKLEVRQKYGSYLTILDSVLSNNDGLFAYDLFNEPEGFAYKTDYEKTEIKEMSEVWYNAINSNHLVTYSLYANNDLFQWDPAILKCDFISFHQYPHLVSSNNYDYNYAVLQTKDTYKWFKNNIKLKWIISETGFPGTGYNNEENLSIGTEQEQVDFLSYTSNAINSSGGTGLIWWQYAEVHWYDFDYGPEARNNCYGLKYSYTNDVPDNIKNTWKPAINNLSTFSLDSLSTEIITTDAEYYNYYNYGYTPITGIITDLCDNPIKDAIIIGHWEYFDDQNESHRIYNKTYSKENGSFTMYVKSPQYDGKLTELKATYLKKENYINTDSLNYSNYYKIKLKDLDSNCTDNIYKTRVLDLNIYPNPTTRFINISTKEKISSIKLYNNVGIIVKEYIDKTIIDISNFNNGIYFLEITSKNKIFFKKIIKV